MSVHFINFKPNTRDKEFLDYHLESLQAHIPSESSILARFRQDRGEYLGIIEIHSVQGEFATSWRADNLKDLIDHLHMQLREQIARWQFHRAQPHEPTSFIRHKWYSETDDPFRGLFDSENQRKTV